MHNVKYFMYEGWVCAAAAQLAVGVDTAAGIY